MSKLFIAIYDWFDKHKSVFYIVLAGLFLILSFFAFRVDFNENINSFFGQDEATSRIFDNIRLKDRITIVVTGDDPDLMVEAGEIYADSLESLIDEGLILSLTRGADDSAVSGSIDFIYEYLPVFLEEEDYARIDSTLTADGVNSAIENAYGLITSPTGMVIKDLLLKDPLSVGTHLMKRFERFGSNMDYELYAGHVFSREMDMMLMFVEPAFGSGSTGDNAGMVKFMEEKAAEVSAATGVDITCVGSSVVAVYNAGQIKKDIAVTMSFALILIILVILLSFRHRGTVPLMILPPAFGALFAMAMVYFIKGSISSIAIGAGSVVLGIALSYSIHVISHSNHVHDRRQIIRDLAYPLTIGSFTTIGAFAALLFTNSPLLQDLGLFAVFALIGTAVFCLVFLPHFLPEKQENATRPLLGMIEKVNGIPYENSKWVVGGIAVITIVSLFFYNDVKFDSDMSNTYYVPEHIAQAQDRLTETFGDDDSGVIVACSYSAENESDYYRLDSLLNSLNAGSEISGYISVRDFIIAPEEQEKKIALWNSFWASRKDRTLELIGKAELEHGFRKGAFSGFSDVLNRDYKVCDYSDLAQVPALSDWINPVEGGLLLLGQINTREEAKAAIYNEINKIDGTCVLDRGYFSSQMIADTSDDFNFILLISSIIVFLALLLSYGRLELALLTFLPMCVSWVIILGFMAIFDIKFNIVNIILATFIFGIGDDFSIFIMDGLLGEYKTGKKTLADHKTAIFFSAFTTIVGMGALLFAQNPVLKSIAVISVLGLVIVVLVSYTVQPFLFRFLISKPVSKGYWPYTVTSILRTALAFNNFLLGCIISNTYSLILFLIPMKKKRKELAFKEILYWFNRIFLRTLPGIRFRKENPGGENFEKPAIIIMNHQSLADLLVMLSMTPKIIMLTNNWVWNSPFFGKIVQKAGYHCIDEGYESLVPKLKAKMDEGYSVVIFPEGSRSADCSIMRFHKGAFYLARELKADILPLVLYGAGKICAKKRPFYIKCGEGTIRICPRVPYSVHSEGTLSYQAKKFRALFKDEYRSLEDKYGSATSIYVRDALIINYLYKGPVLEWYMRIKMKMDGWYALWDEIIPRDATVTDIGCGYGQMCFCLGMRAPERRIYGIDYDEEKIMVASHSLLCRPGMTFRHDDMTRCEMPQSDVFLFNDSLHYVSEAAQKGVLERCLKALNSGGMMIIRDADASDEKGQEKVERIEKWSTEIIRFNKTVEKLSFTSRGMVMDFAQEHGLELEIRKCPDDTSETLYILTKNDDEKVD